MNKSVVSFIGAVGLVGLVSTAVAQPGPGFRRPAIKGLTPAVAVDAEDPFGGPDAPMPAEKQEETAAETEEPEAAEAPREPVDPQLVRLSLMDGSLLTGKLEVKEIEVETRFGKLTIPVDSIKSFKPGLDSYPEVKKEVETLIENLGSDDFAERESARKKLAGMGHKVEAELRLRLKDENAERIRLIRTLLEELATIESADDDESADQPWQRLDTVETTDFTVLGKISPQSFAVNSQYGPLTIQLAHILKAQRDFSTRESIRKSMSVEGQHLAQLGFKNSAIRVSRGDQVSVTADGTILMSPWGSGSNSTPDGAQNYGIYQDQIWGGTLVARIGDSGKIFKVGSKHTFTADRTGVLQFAIAMQHEYAQGNYQFPGKYNLKIKVDPQ